jgi:hypothetical protein
MVIRRGLGFFFGISRRLHRLLLDRRARPARGFLTGNIPAFLSRT